MSEIVISFAERVREPKTKTKPNECQKSHQK